MPLYIAYIAICQFCFELARVMLIRVKGVILVPLNSFLDKYEGKTMLTNKTNILRTGIAALALAGTAIVASPAMAEVSASAAVANMYLWRGIDLGDGSAAVSGDLVYSNSGAYVGIWVSSGDDRVNMSPSFSRI